MGHHWPVSHTLFHFVLIVDLSAKHMVIEPCHFNDGLQVILYVLPRSTCPVVNVSSHVCAFCCSNSEASLLINPASFRRNQAKVLVCDELTFNLLRDEHEELLKNPPVGCTCEESTYQDNKLCCPTCVVDEACRYLSILYF